MVHIRALCMYCMVGSMTIITCCNDYEAKAPLQPFYNTPIGKHRWCAKLFLRSLLVSNMLGVCRYMYLTISHFVAWRASSQNIVTNNLLCCGRNHFLLDSSFFGNTLPFLPLNQILATFLDMALFVTQMRR